MIIFPFGVEVVNVFWGLIIRRIILEAEWPLESGFCSNPVNKLQRTELR